MKGKILIQSIKDALQIGYRAIDTASVYNNHNDIGTALTEIFETTSIKREDLFIQTKIGKHEH